jgi:hypothetical protein
LAETIGACLEWKWQSCSFFGCQRALALKRQFHLPPVQCGRGAGAKDESKSLVTEPDCGTSRNIAALVAAVIIIDTYQYDIAICAFAVYRRIVIASVTTLNVIAGTLARNTKTEKTRDKVI